MSKLLTGADFERLRSDAESRRDELVRVVAAARVEILDIEKFLARLEVTQQYVTMSSSGDENRSPDGSSSKHTTCEPGLPQMVSHVLHLDLIRSASGEKGQGLKPSEIASEIAKLFKETVGVRAVNAHVWYLFSKNRVAKKGMRYFLPTNGMATPRDEGIAVSHDVTQTLAS